MIEYKLEKFFDVVIIWLVLEGGGGDGAGMSSAAIVGALAAVTVTPRAVEKSPVEVCRI